MNGENFKMIATTFKGLEKVLAREVQELGGQRPRPLVRAVEFYGDKGFMYKANLRLATALRILKPIAHLRNIRSVAALYDKIKAIPWEAYFDVNKTVYFHISGRLDTLPHTHFVSQKAKDALADRFREVTGYRPSVSKDNPDIRIDLHLFRDQISVSLDASGDPLFKRGYRTATGPAPLNEVLAAGMLRLARWKGQTHLIDPMCGSGTIPIEGALLAANIPPGIFREKFAFMQWKDFDPALFAQIRDAVMKHVREPLEIIRIIGYDKEAYLVEKALKNLASAGVDQFVSCEAKDFFLTRKIPGPVTMLFNPPYDRRLPVDDRDKFYRRIARHLEDNYQRAEVWIVSEHSFDRYFKRRPFRKFHLMNGKIPVTFAGYKMD